MSTPPRSPANLPGALDEQNVFRSLFAAYPDGLIVSDVDGTIVLANQAAATLLRYSVDELVGLSVDALVPDSIRPRHASHRHAYGRDPQPRPMGLQMDLSARRRDGSKVLVEIALSPLQDHGLPYVVAAIRDISAYPRVKQALRRARFSEHLAQLGRLAVDARDPQVLLQQVPTIAAQALQVELAIVLLLEPNRNEFRVHGGIGLIDGEHHGDHLPNLPDTPARFVLEHGRPVVVTDYRSEQRFRVPPAYLEAGLTSGLSVPLLDRGRAVGVLKVRSREARHFDDDDVRFLESLSNLLVTSLQRAQTEEALSHSQRLESVGQLTGGIAHDFNNLLTVIQGNLQVLEELPAIAEDAHGQQLVGAAMCASRRGAELTGKLLAFSRRQVLQPSAVDVGALLGSLADMLRRTLDQRIRIDVETPAATPTTVLADPGQLESALLNIAINARDAMPEGGTLRFRAEPCAVLPPHVRGELDDPSAPDDSFVAVSIADTGSGMSGEVRERAFEPFFTTKEAGRGTGLGLSTVYGFVKQSKGAVALDSSPGRGTTLTLYIPHAWSSERLAGAGAAGEAVPRGLEVLLVEDDTEVRKVVHAFLDALGCRVTTAVSGEQALLDLVAGGRYELLLSDIALGSGMQGTQLASEAQRHLPGLSVLLMSGYSEELLQADRDSPPGWDLLRKPFSRAELAAAIVGVLRDRDAAD
ncbi:MAG: GAF domain-containing protein [Caldimonas sp.]